MSSAESLLNARNLYISNNGVTSCGWVHQLKRWFVPFFASAQDQKVADYFVSTFKRYLEGEPVDRLKEYIALADRFSGEAAARLEHYTLAAKKRLGIPCTTEQCAKDNRALLAKWKKWGFAQEAFWLRPDLVDFIFKSHLDRHLSHPFYRHTVNVEWRLGRQEGKIQALREPTLLVDGKSTPWSEICRTLHLDEENRLYSMESGEKVFWMYLDQGLTRWDRLQFDQLRPIKKDSTPPEKTQIQIVTTRAHKENWDLSDRLLKGARHTFFRIHVGRGFAQRNPGAGLVDGGLYSVGWGVSRRHFSPWTPLGTMPGEWSCPDNFEFLKHDFYVTPVDTTEEKVQKLMQLLREKNKTVLPFHPITSNCCSLTSKLLQEAGVISLDTKSHMAFLWYQLLVPKFLRKPLGFLAKGVREITPRFILKVAKGIGSLSYSIVFSPLFTLLGAFKINYTREALNRKCVEVSNKLNALFTNFIDLFRPSKMTFDMTRNVYKWQTKQSQTYVDKRN